MERVDQFSEQERADLSVRDEVGVPPSPQDIQLSLEKLRSLDLASIKPSRAVLPDSEGIPTFAHPSTLEATPGVGLTRLPATAAQAQLWLLNALDPTDASYHKPIALRLSGPLRRDALLAALQALLDRHDALRATFFEEDGAILQKVVPRVEAGIEETDLSGLPDGQREAAAVRTATAFLQRPFDLGNGIPLRVALMRLGEDHHLLLLVVHHIQSDGHSHQQIGSQLSAFYGQYLQRGTVTFQRLPRQAVSWGAAERAFLSTPEADAQAAFWKAQLEDFSSVAEWPVRKRNPVALPEGPRTGTRRLMLDTGLVNEVHARSGTSSGTLYRFLLASYYVLLHRLLGSRSLTVGIPVHNRTDPSERELIGFRMKMLPLVLRVDGEMTFTSLLGQLNQKLNGALRNMKLPADILMGSITGREPGPGERIFHSLFNFKEDPAAAFRFSGLETSAFPIPPSHPKTDLSILLAKRADEGGWSGYEVTVNYDRAIFPDKDIRHLVDRWLLLIRQCIADPAMRIGRMDALLPAEKQLVLRDWNATSVPGYPSKCLHELFTEQAKLNPHHTALVSDTGDLTYGTLDRMSDNLAVYLRHAGLTEGAVVGLQMRRSPGMVICILAVMKAGGTYLPIDGGSPAERTLHIIREAGIRLLFSDRPDSFGLGDELQIIDVASALAASRRFDGLEMPVCRNPDATAYLMYTSGSTGRPKGVRISHRNIVNRIVYTKKRIGFGPDDRTLQKSSPGFDVSIPEIFLPLVSGGSVVLAPPERVLAPEQLADLIARQKVTYVHFVASQLRSFLAIGRHAGADGCLKTIWCGGEAMSNGLMQQCMDTYRARLFHGYGPTETAVGVTVWECSRDMASEHPPIGRPIDNTVIYLLNEQGSPVPPGVIGEIHIGGVQVGQGYLDRPERTAERFIPDPLDPGSGRTFYRTGDLARYLEGGDLLFVGRNDDQVKIRGHRVEPEEVAAALRRCAGVTDAAVLVEQGPDGTDRLVAYLETDEARPDPEEALRPELSRLLPEHMMPARFTRVERMPLTTNGKVDKAALRSLPSGDNDRKPDLEPLMAGTESAIGDIWSGLLGIRPIGPSDDFFSRGGHSLLALRAAAMVRKRMNVDVSLSDFYRHSTPRALGRLLEGRLPTTAVASPAKAPADARIPMSAAQRRFWLLQQLRPDPSAYHVTRILQVDPTLPLNLLQTALHTLAERHEILRTSLHADGGELFQAVLPMERFRLDWNASQTAPDGRNAIVAAEKARGFDLSNAPLWRVMHLDDGIRSELCLTFHHAVTDAWSMRLFLAEFERLLTAGGDAMRAGLRPPAFQYADFACWQRALLEGHERERQEQFWRKRLEGTEKAMLLAPDRPASDNTPPDRTAGNRERLTVTLDRDLALRLENVAREDGLTLFHLTLAALQACLFRMSGNRDILVGTPVSERRMAEWQELLGCFLNTLPVRMHVDPSLTFKAFARLVRTELEDVFSHADLPFEDIAALAEGPMPAGGGTRRLFQLMFVLQERDASEDAGSALEAVLAPAPAKHEISCVIDRCGSDWHLHLDFDGMLFGQERMRALLESYHSLLRSVAEDPAQGLSAMKVLPVEVLRGEPDGSDAPVVRTYPNVGLHDLFREQARIHPQLPAVISDEGTRTYSEIDAMSDAVAAHLVTLGVSTDRPVGVHMQRSHDLVIAVLSVLKAGGAFLPIDIHGPAERVCHMIADADARIVLSDRPLPEGLSIPVHCLSVADAIRESRKTDTPATLPVVNPSDLAYVIYTSGSTGKPKGAMVEHRNIVNRLCHTRECFGFGPDDRALQKSPLSFDVCLTEFFLPLISGGSVVLAPPDRVLSPQQLADAICRHRVSYVHFVPPMLREFLSVSDIRKVNGVLRHIRCGGEPLPRQLMLDCLSTLDAALYQSYGPAETAVAVTLWRCRADHPHDTPPIGRPNANTIIRLLDADGLAVPRGSTGEVWIGGAQVGRGYVNNPGLTAERFLPDPLEPGSGRTFYRTGDLARYLDDGNLVFVGRNDDQVKIRGHRVEPAEVTASIRAAAGVRDAFVLPGMDTRGERFLTAFIVQAGDDFPGIGTLRQDLLRILPEAMVPARFQLLDAMPLTRHGKVDREALQKLQWTSGGSSSEPPATDTERMLSGLWAELLGIESPGRSTDFFALGGHSLTALRLIARVRQVAGASLGLNDIYRYPILHALAAQVDRSVAQGNAPEVPAAPPAGPVPMSHGQRRFWLLHRMMARPSAFHITRLMRFGIDTSPTLLRQVLLALFARHEVLRTRLVVEGDAFLQVIDAADPERLPWHEMAGPSGMDALADPDGWLAAERERPFDLSAEFAWRILHYTSQGHRYLYLILHHAVTDEWSTKRFLSEFDRLLENGADPIRAGLPVLTQRYADYAHARQQMHPADRERSERFWKAELSDLSGMLRLTPDIPASDQTPGLMGRVSYTFDADTCAAVRRFAGEEGLSHFTVFLAAFQLLLHRLTGEDDLLVGIPVSERSRADWQDVMGFFLNTVPVRARPRPEMTFRAYTRALRSRLEEVFAHATLPYRDIAALAGGVGDIPFNAILSLMFILLERDDSGTEAPDGLRMVDGPASRHTYDDLVWLVDISGDQWKGAVKYDASRYSAGRMEQYTEVYRFLLQQFVREPDRPVGWPELLDGTARASVLALGEGRSVPLPATPLIHRVFEQQVLQSPDAIAIECDGLHLSYESVDRSANRWAHRLRMSAAAGPGDTVAIILPRSEQLVIAILAVLKTGAACLPIDPGLPPSRISYMLADSGARLVMGLPEAAALADMPQLIDMSGSVDGLPGDAPNVPLQADADAYCMYTSGSTGQPKGIYNTHRGFTNMILSHNRFMGIRGDDRVLQSTSPSFDVSLYEVFTAFFAGATLVVADKTGLSVLPSFIVNKRVSVAMLTPMVVGTLDTGTLSHLRVLISGGEEARPADAARLAGKVAWYNTYGPTEVSVWSTIHRIGELADESRKVPIGRPVDNTRILILDRHLRLMPAGVTGELCIGGMGLGTGYHNRPALSAERFIADPFHPGERLYRTGDMAYWDRQGNLIFIGRRDGQMKVMGYRIEPGEVVAALQQLPGVRQATVIARKRDGQETMLVAFVVPEGDGLPDEHACRDILAGLLPSYMLPARMHSIPEIPLTSNRKVDLRRLGEFDEEYLLREEAQDRNAPAQRPATDTEQRLAGIWASLLERPTIGRDDNFFSLGGHSLHLIRLMVLVNRIWGIPVDISRIYTRTTLRSMAQLIDEQRRDLSIPVQQGIGDVVVWNPDGPRTVHVMVGGAGSVEEFTKYHRIGECLGEGHRIQILPDPDTVADRFPRSDAGTLAREYARQILVRQPEGPHVLLGDCIGGVDAFATACELQRLSAGPVRLILMDTLAPLPEAPAGRGPLGLGIYEALPEVASALHEALFGLFLRISASPAIRRWLHWMPKSKREVARMATAYGLFDPAHANGTPPAGGRSAADAFRQYATDGWKELQPPSGTFNPFRYRRNQPDFDISADNPVLHAILIGMRTRFMRGKILSYGTGRQLKSDLISARTYLRRERYRPTVFRGDVDIVVSSIIHRKNPSMGWRRHVDGELRIHRAEGDHRTYLKERLADTGALLRRILEGVAEDGQGRD